MPNLSAHEQALAKRAGTSSRLMAHRLANYDAAQAKAAGPQFEAQWKAHRETTVGPATASQPKAQPVTSAPAPTVAATPQPKSTLTAADKAVLEGQRRQRIAAQVASPKAAAVRTAERRQAEIAESWRQVHAELHDPFGYDDREDPDANFGWAGIHAEIQARRGN
ncbi:membrane protein involved in colicin uptake [Sphingobium chlorophenolicum L-1]|uniref:Membrane protein involved in colicin uptake n=1 Tax=Sphingobium chlorophenolicum L-1 TaxID=690566 RepID=F6F2V1_SPHCR|nr:hypothetical protein [Sphingobium chlorophenolicum]AEG50763.1 membrane protein involved in colicin uptake [Sphingobium chlorophenolicum L-1]